MEKNTNTRHDGSIPTLREYLQTKAAEARLNATKHILQQETPNVPIIPSRSPWSIAAAVLGWYFLYSLLFYFVNFIRT